MQVRKLINDSYSSSTVPHSAACSYLGERSESLVPVVKGKSAYAEVAPYACPELAERLGGCPLNSLVVHPLGCSTKSPEEIRLPLAAASPDDSHLQPWSVVRRPADERGPLGDPVVQIGGRYTGLPRSGPLPAECV